MRSITINLKDGSVRKFLHEGRPGGSYTKRLKFEEGFLIVVDEWGNETGFPTSEISSYQTQE